MAFEGLAVLTNEAKRRIVDMWEFGKSYQVKFFAVSAGGHDPSDPETAVAVDPASTDMPGVITFGPENIDNIERKSDDCPVFVCRIEPGELTGSISSVGLFAEIVFNGTDPINELGVTFLYAVYNRPLFPSTGTDQLEFRISVFL
jgi:hypothetical protein